METASKWTSGSTISQAPAAPREVETGSPSDWFAQLRRVISRICGVAFCARHRYRAAEGASDAELARLVRGGVTIDDARWQNARNLYGGGRHV